MDVNWRGVFTALVTPFHPDHEFDEKAMRNLVERQIKSGVAGLVPCGTTGEGASMTPAEHQRVVATVVDQAAGRVPVIAGAGSNRFLTSLELSHRCVDAGADALLLVTPSYIKPTQKGLIHYFESLADAIEIPIILYNVPGRTAVTLEPASIRHLAHYPNIIALKQAVADLNVLNAVLYDRPADFYVLSGEDALTLPMIAMGADGVISVTSNVAPGLMVELVDAALTGDRDRAMVIQARLVPLIKALFVESNPIPVKFALAQMHLLCDVLCPPMESLAPEFHQLVVSAMETAGISPARAVAESIDEIEVHYV